MEKLTFNSNEEIFEYLNDECLSVDLINNDCVSISDFSDSVIGKEVEARGYHYFEDESDIETYIEDSMGKYVFNDESDIQDWVSENIYSEDELTTSAPVGMYRSDCIGLINDLVEEHGWEWLHRRLELM